MHIYTDLCLFSIEPGRFGLVDLAWWIWLDVLSLAYLAWLVWLRELLAYKSILNIF